MTPPTSSPTTHRRPTCVCPGLCALPCCLHCPPLQGPHQLFNSSLFISHGHVMALAETAIKVPSTPVMVLVGAPAASKGTITTHSHRGIGWTSTHIEVLSGTMSHKCLGCWFVFKWPCDGGFGAPCASSSTCVLGDQEDCSPHGPRNMLRRAHNDVLKKPLDMSVQTMPCRPRAPQPPPCAGLPCSTARAWAFSIHALSTFLGLPMSTALDHHVASPKLVGPKIDDKFTRALVVGEVLRRIVGRSRSTSPQFRQACISYHAG